MFRILILSAWTLLHFYVFWRASTVPAIARRVPRPALAWIGTGCWAGLLAALVLGHDGGGFWAAALEFVGMDWMAGLFIAGACLLAADLATGFGLLFRERAPGLRGWALLAAILLIAVALVQGLRPPVVVDYPVRLAGLPPERDGTVLVALSDLHLGGQLGPRWFSARVDQVMALHPDLIVLLGDLFEGHGRPPATAADFRRLRAPLGVWAVQGNHESHGDRDAALPLLEQAGITVLRDRWAEAAPGLVLAGVDDLTSRRRRGEAGPFIGRALAGRPPGAVVLLSHTPWEAEEAAHDGVGLMLSGHTHGGQIWPFGYLVRLTYPLLGGRYSIDGMSVIVCRGTGLWGPRMRLWRPGEIVRITLKSAS